MFGWLSEGQFRFTLKPREPIDVGRQAGRQHFDCDLAFELRVARAIDLSHAPSTDRAKNLVGAEASTDA